MIEILAAISVAGVIALAFRVHRLNTSLNLLGESLYHLHLQYSKDHGTQMYDMLTGERVNDSSDEQ